MMDKNANSMRTPLRNSNSANKPFCSPFKRDNTTPVKKETFKRLLSSPVQTSSSQNNVNKRRRIEIDDTKVIDESKNDLNISKNQLINLKKQIRNLRQEIESVKIKLASRNKHKKEDLRAEIDKWRLACHKALIQYQKDCLENNPNNESVEMSNILLILGIPEKIIKFPKDF